MNYNFELYKYEFKMTNDKWQYTTTRATIDAGRLCAADQQAQGTCNQFINFNFSIGKWKLRLNYAENYAYEDEFHSLLEYRTSRVV